MFDWLFAAPWTLDRCSLDDALLAFSSGIYGFVGWLEDIPDQIAPMLPADDLNDVERYALWRLRCLAIKQPPLGIEPPDAARLTPWLSDGGAFWLVPGEHWADRLHKDVARINDEQRNAWFELIRFATTATASKPSAKWKKQGLAHVKSIGEAHFREHVGPWFEAAAKGRSMPFIGVGYNGPSEVMNEGNATAMRGLVWMLACAPDINTPRILGALLLTSIKKVPGVGPRGVKVANACIWALGDIAGHDDPAIGEAALGQLARLKAKVTFKTTLKAIEKAFDKAAERAGISRDDIEELGIPTIGFEKGTLTQTLGDAHAELRVQRNSVAIQWINAKGKHVKSPPASVKRDFKDEVKQLKQIAKDATGILQAARNRLDTIYLLNKSWTLADWRKRYLDHGLLQPIVQRLIWSVDQVPVMFLDDQAVDIQGKPLEFAASAEVTLWHPVSQDTQDVLAWREFLEQRQITQPFKQAHREIYLLTDAERNTNVYSNRFAAHILKQHQFNALCAARRWNNKLRLLVDDEYPPASRDLSQWNLRAEFWIEGIGDDYGTDTNETGTFLYLTTDQVRFYPIDAAPPSAHAGGGGYAWRGPVDGEAPEAIALEQIPPLVFSEIMRDIDLFVGVSSVSADPNWADGGPEGRYYEYWHSRAFGDLSATGQTRRQTLEKLIPRLKIADRCSFTERFLIVRGDRRTYKIHLGSGNILMEPNDQYLCIVPKASSVTRASDGVYLPFEGDRTLSIILSKAFLLADEKRIKDRTILQQIEHS